MYLAMSMDGKTLENNVSQQFETAKYLLVVDTTSLSVSAIENCESFSAESLAQKVIDLNCEGIITGAISDPQAFEILASKPHLDLMVTDFRLPGGISGVQIAEPAVKLRPDLKVIFISGYPQEIRETDSPITRKAPILGKPFDLDKLKEIIQNQLV